jgi:hypothetical protein
VNAGGVIEISRYLGTQLMHGSYNLVFCDCWTNSNCGLFSVSSSPLSGPVATLSGYASVSLARLVF